MDLASQAQQIVPAARRSPIKGFEHYRGYGVMNLPFSSGHLLGLRVFPENDFAPYASVWHRTPEGAWSIYSDGPSLRTTCPRWWGPALDHAELVSIDLEWTGPNELRVEMREPELVWTVSMNAPSHLRALNAFGRNLPRWTWRPAALRRAREWIAWKLFGLGELQFSFIAPTGGRALIMPAQFFLIERSQANLNGQDLGRPIHLSATPKIGDIPLPSRPSFMLGEAFGEIRDAEEYQRTRRSVQSQVRAAEQ